MSWVKQQRLPAVKTIHFQDQPCNDLSDLWRALHQSYNTAANHSVDLSVLDEVPSQATHSWMPFSLLEMQEVFKVCSNISAPGSNHITWWYFKHILSNNTCAIGIFSLANACLSLHHWPRYFKELVSIIIPKLGKPAYDTSKAFRPIVLLNTLGKLIEKIIARKLVKHGLHWGGSPQNGLGDMQTCRTTLASAYVLFHLSTMWSQLQMIERSLRWK